MKPVFSAQIVSGVIAASNGPVQIAYVDDAGNTIGRTAGIGDPVHLNDEITTGADMSLQVLLKDQTVFSIGPNSTLVFDEFIFDPSSAETASLQASVTKGSFKFISGKISKLKPGAMTLNLPNATASVRGTSVAGRIDETGASDIILLTGAIQLASAQTAPIDIIQSGWGISVSATGDLGDPEPYALEDINAIIEETTPEADEGSNDGSGTGTLTLASAPGTAAEIEEVGALLLAAVEAGAEDVSAADLITQILRNDALIQRFAGNDIALEVLQDSLESNVVIDTDLIAYIVGGGIPLWFYYDGTNGPVNPVPVNNPSFANDLATYNNSYAGLVSSSYSGSVRFQKSDLALAPATGVTNGDTGSGTASFDIVLDYGTAAVTGSFSTSDIIINNVNFGSVSTTNPSTTISNTLQTGNIAGLLDGVNLLSGASLQNNATVEFVGSFGSITNGFTTEDGTLGGFEVNVHRAGESDPSLKGENFQIGTLQP